MANLLPGDAFGRVADFLLAEATDIPADTTLWGQCEDGRARSATSRGYYGAFLLLKQRLRSARADWRRDERTFPRDQVHWKVLEAVKRRLGDTSQVFLLLRGLLRERKIADYELTPFYDCNLADGFVDQAWDAINAISTLTTAEVNGIANELFDIELGV